MQSLAPLKKLYLENFTAEYAEIAEYFVENLCGLCAFAVRILPFFRRVKSPT
jgi:hypothetical protein